MAGKALATNATGACPKCGTPLRARSVRDSIDRPLEQCGRCGEFVIRPGATEWDLLKADEQLRHVARFAGIAFAGGLVLAAIGGAIRLTQSRHLEVREALLLFAAGCVVAGGWAGSRLASRIRNSRRRMRDPMYLAKLAEHEMAVGPRHG